MNVEGKELKQTPKAYLVEIDGANYWLPKSKVTQNTDGTWNIPTWLAEKNGLKPTTKVEKPRPSQAPLTAYEQPVLNRDEESALEKEIEERQERESIIAGELGLNPSPALDSNLITIEDRSPNRPRRIDYEHEVQDIDIDHELVSQLRKSFDSARTKVADHTTSLDKAMNDMGQGTPETPWRSSLHDIEESELRLIDELISILEKPKCDCGSSMVLDDNGTAVCSNNECSNQPWLQL